MKKFLIALFALVLCLALVACGGKDKEQDNVISDIENGSAIGADGKLTMTSDDTKYVITNGASTSVFYHDGKNVTGFALYTDFETEEAAKAVYEAYKSMYEEQDFVKKVYCNKNYFIVEYTQEYVAENFDSTELEGIKQLYSYIGAAK